jgi:hypothetical protein
MYITLKSWVKTEHGCNPVFFATVLTVLHFGRTCSLLAGVAGYTQTPAFAYLDAFTQMAWGLSGGALPV